jgi:hypothetical protein
VPCDSAQTASDVAKETLASYKNKDLAGVKKYTAPMIAAAMDDKFFEDKEIKAEVEALQSWDGKVKEVRYFKSRMGLMASAHYDDADKDTYRTLALINAGYGWKQMGVSTVKKKKFLTYDKKEPVVKKDDKAADESPKTNGAALKDQLGALGFGFGKKKTKTAKKEEQAPAAADKAAGGYSVEMADGTTADAPGDGQLKKMLGTLSSDNFFLTLTGPSGFMQAAYTAKGLDMQYKDASGHFASETAMPAETAAAMFKAYLAGETGWKAQCKWKPFE